MIFQKVNMIFMKKILLVGFCFLAFASFAQRNIPEVPKEQKAVYDFADMLNDSEEMALRQKLETYADTTSTQIVIATIQSLEGEYIALYATEWAQKWGIGQKGKDNGEIILVSKNDRKITIQNGYGLEEYLTDYNSKTIIDQIIEPEFKRGDFYAGFDKGTSAMIDLLAGNFDADALRNNKKSDFNFFKLIPIIFIIIVIIISISRRNRGGGRGSGGRNRGPDLFDILILSSLGGRHSSGGSFGGSSGGFGGGGGFSGGFGGGGFGGGGAVGGW
jgi:uncharacterized protein